MKTILALILGIAATAAGAARIVPANPTEFQNVDLRLETDGTDFFADPRADRRGRDRVGRLPADGAALQ